ncbi:MAG: AsmA family protein [Syntrophobacteraceae bacterium]
MKRSHFRLIVLLLIAIPVVLITVLLATFDVNSYRPGIEAALSERVGRLVTLGGPIHLDLSLSGIDLAVEKVAVAGPGGSQAPDTARIGHLALAVAFLPLLRHELDITSLSASDVNVRLDHAAVLPASSAAKAKTPAPPENTEKPLGFSVSTIAVEKVNLFIEGENGETAHYVIDTLALSSKGSRMQLAAKGTVNGSPLSLDVSGPKGFARLSRAPWPFTGKARYAGLTVETNGTLDVPGRKIEVNALTLTAGATKVRAKLAIAYGGARPVVQGTISSDMLNPKDLESAIPEEAKADRGGQKNVHGAKPVPFNDLRAIDANLAVTIGDLHVGKGSFKQVAATVDLNGGRLALSNVNALLAGGKLDGKIELDAQKSPARIEAAFHTNGVDVGQLAKLGGHQSFFLQGTSDIDFALTSEGESSQGLVDHARGRITFVMGDGAVRVRELAGLPSELLNTLIPGAGGSTNYRVNCLAARFNVRGSRLQTNGILLDTRAATLLGRGEINLKGKTIDMLVHSRSKLVNVADLAPALRVSGPLANPHFSIDASSYVNKVERLIGNRSVSDVPAVSSQGGQNACLNALDHPNAGQTVLPSVGGVQKILNKAGGSINGLGGQILNGIGGAFGK